MAPKSVLNLLERLIGEWTTEATHPMLPGVVVHGTAVIEWLEGGQFLMIRSRNEHPDFPDALSMLGFIGRDRAEEATENRPLRMHYYDSRGVYRDYESSIDEKAWRCERLARGFSQRFVGTFADGGDTIVGSWQLCKDERNWHDDLKITYRRHKRDG